MRHDGEMLARLVAQAESGGGIGTLGIGRALTIDLPGGLAT